RTVCLSMLVCLTSSAGAEDAFPPVADLPKRAELPDPLVLFNGERVSTPDQWRQKRRPELKALFEFYMYGRAPASPNNVKSRVALVEHDYFDGKATKKQVTISFGPPGTPEIHLLLIVPNRRQRPAPVFVGMNFHGNHTLVDDAHVPLPTVWVRDGTPGIKDHKATD